jgi:hypothetical protein
MAGNQNIADVVACVFHIGFSLISAARSVLSVFVAYFTKIIPHLKRFLNISFQNLAKTPAKLPGTVLCKLTLGCKTDGLKKAELPAARIGAEPGVFVANMRVL